MLSSAPPFIRHSVALALFRMLTSDRYCISTVRQALDAAGLDAARSGSPDHAAFAALRLHHCTRFDDMPDAFRDELARHTLALFGAERHGTLHDLALLAECSDVLLVVA